MVLKGFTHEKVEKQNVSSVQPYVCHTVKGLNPGVTVDRVV